MEQKIGAEEQRSAPGGNHPERHQPQHRVAPVLDALPARRQLRLEAAPQRLDLPIEIAPDFGEPVGALLIEAIASLEAERQARVQHLEHRDVALRLGEHPLENLKEFFAPVRFAMEGHEQGLPRPGALRTPRRAHHRLIDDRAQGVAGGQHVLGRHVRLSHPGLERAHLLDTLSAQALEICARDLTAQPGGEDQERHGGLEDRIGGLRHEFVEAWSSVADVGESGAFAGVGGRRPGLGRSSVPSLGAKGLSGGGVELGLTMCSESPTSPSPAQETHPTGGSRCHQMP